MAAYSQNIALADLLQPIETWHNTTEKIMLEEIFSLLITEFAAMETAGLAGYTVTSSLENTLIHELLLKSNVHGSKKILERVISLIIDEFDLVETNGLSYTQSGITAALKVLVENYPNVEARITLHKIFDLLNAEWVLLEAAS